MRVAIVHDYLNQYGGAERVLEVLAEMFPDADFYTLFYDKGKTFGRFSRLNFKTSFLDKLPFVKGAHRAFIPFLPFGAENLNLGDGYDLIISETAGYAKGINYRRGFHISYCYTPLRYAWEPEYINMKYKALNAKLIGLLAKPITFWLRKWDFKASKRPDVIVADSQFISGKISRYYQRDAGVIYPPLDLKVFYSDPAVKKKNYFLALGRLLHYKKFDLIVETFNELKLPLKIVGNGPELKRLKKSAAANIEFLPFVESEAELRKIYSGARALIFPQIEDFGLAAAEAIACGTPVIAYRVGGALEIIEEGKSGLFFDEQTPASLKEAVRGFLKQKFEAVKVSQGAAKFSKERFKKEFLKVIYENCR